MTQSPLLTGLIVLLALLWLSPARAKAAPLPCSVALRLDLSTYLLTVTEFSDSTSIDRASFDYAHCQEVRLSAELSRTPRLKARIDSLRSAYADLTSLECSLGRQIEGGTFFTHALPRRLPELETTLRGLAALASSEAGARTGARFTDSIQTSRRAWNQRLSALKRWAATPPDTLGIEPAVVQADVQRYDEAGQRLMKLLGSHPDAATAAGYLPLQTSVCLGDTLEK